MHLNRFQKILFGLGISLFVLAAALAVQSVFARQPAAPETQISIIHPTFPLLDENDANVLTSGLPVSTIKTCGQCHDTDFITSHSFHSDLGLSEATTAGEVAGGKEWDTSPGLYGKWDPLTYRFLSPAGDSRLDLDTAAWVSFNAARLVGGGPAASSGLEMNCFLCHFDQPNNTERILAIQSGKPAWASTATLLGTGVVDATADGYAWNPAAFNEQGELSEVYVTIHDPSNANCAQCHGLVHTDSEQVLTLPEPSLDNWQTYTTGQVISAQKMSLSGVNLKDKASLTRSWDIHAERGLSCTDCHYSLNNPAYVQTEAKSQPSHLEFDPRRLEISEFLVKPNHNFARGQSAQFTIAQEQKGSMRRCEGCHTTAGHANWLPYVERHMQEIACETCHIPQLYAQALQSVDWSVLQADGQPLRQLRGSEIAAGSVNELVTGFEPVLLQRQDIDGGQKLAPFNLIVSYYWVYDSPQGVRPVLLQDLNTVWLGTDGYSPEIVAAFDNDGDGQLSQGELAINTAAKQALIAGKLSTLGLSNPRIQGDVQPYSINHNVTRGEWATRDCQSCHSDQSRLASSMVLTASLPVDSAGNAIVPEFVSDSNTRSSDGLSVESGTLIYTPKPADHGLYVFGHSRAAWVDIVGALLFVAVLGAVIVHGGLRYSQALYRRRRTRSRPQTEKVYMYQVYERFWHWLQTFTIVLLLLTGLVIHRPDLFGWLSFRYIVLVHNILAAILVINAALSLFYHLVSGDIQQYIPRPYGFFDQAIVQAKYYLQGIFKGKGHPFEKTPRKKLNPLQQITYFGILNVLLPLQILSGALMWGVQRWPKIAEWLGGLPYLAPFHSLVAWSFGAFIVAHVYLTTTVGNEPLAGIKAMIAGFEEVEVHDSQHPEHKSEKPSEKPAPGSASDPVSPE